MTDTINILIVDDLADTRLNVQKLLQFEGDMKVIGHARNGEEALRLAREMLPDVILMDINMPGMDGIQASRSISQSVPTAQIIIMSVQSDADYFRRSMLAGARDFLTKPFSSDELATAVRRVHENRPAHLTMPVANPSEPVAVTSKPTRHSEGRIIAVYSPKGGSGCTTLSVNLAVAMARQKHRTLLLDGNFQFGDAAVMLNVKASTSILDLLDRLDDLDADLVNSVAVTHSSGLRVILAPPRPEMAELIKPAQFERLLRFLRQQVDFVIVDTASGLNENTLTALDVADRILVTTHQRLPSLKSASLFFDLTANLDYDPGKTSLVVNRSNGNHQVSVRDVAEILKQPVMAAIPDDEAAAIVAADQGYPLVSGPAQKRPIAQALRDLADQLVLIWEAPEEPVPELAAGPKLGRLFGSR